MSDVDQAALWARVSLAGTAATAWGAASLMLCTGGVVVGTASVPPSELGIIGGLYLTLLTLRTAPATLLAAIGLLVVPRFQREPGAGMAGVIAACALGAPLVSALGAVLTLPFLSCLILLEVPFHVLTLLGGFGAGAQVLRISSRALAASE
ncbi:MAG: hypothetical protein KC912_04255 [Proteobacteria bacterium]|nr:hypothetical protein [Pseudomonadota bacterium]